MHGGTNPGAPRGNSNARKHDGYSTKAKAAVQYVKELRGWCAKRHGLNLFGSHPAFFGAFGQLPVASHF
jgi:hypothetical protein